MPPPAEPPPAPARRKPKPLPGLTGLRGAGALWVVAYHLQFGHQVPVADAGYLGVDVFLIMSGFVLSHAHPEPRWTWPRYRAFLRARAARIFPMHWFVLALLGTAILAMPALREAAPLHYQWPGLLASAALVQNWGFTPPAIWNIPAWTLSAEWAVSIAFPVFLSAANRIRSARWAFALGAACILAFAAFLALTNNDGPNVIGRAGLVRAACEFAAGCVLYRAYAAGAVLGPATAAAAALLAATGILIPAVSVVAIFGLLPIVLLSAQDSGTVARALSGKAMAFLGEISYSIYLLHYPLLLLFQHGQDRLSLHGPAALPWYGLYLASVLGLSSLTYPLIERPIRDRMRRPARPPAGYAPPASP